MSQNLLNQNAEIQKQSDEIVNKFRIELTDAYSQIMSLLSKMQFSKQTLQLFKNYQGALQSFTSLYNQMHINGTYTQLPMIPNEQAKDEFSMQEIQEEYQSKILQENQDTFQSNEQLLQQLEQQEDLFNTLQSLLQELKDFLIEIIEQVHMPIMLQDKMLKQSIDRLMLSRINQGEQEQQKLELKTNKDFVTDQILLIEQIIKQSTERTLKSESFLTVLAVKTEQELQFFIQELLKFVKTELPKLNQLLPLHVQIKNESINASNYKIILNSIQEFVSQSEKKKINPNLLQGQATTINIHQNINLKVIVLERKIERCKQKQAKLQTNEQIFNLLHKELMQRGVYNDLLKQLNQTDDVPLIALVDNFVEGYQQLQNNQYACNAWKQCNLVKGKETKEQCINELSTKIQQYRDSQNSIIIEAQKQGQSSSDQISLILEQFLQIDANLFKYQIAVKALQSTECKTAKQFEEQIQQEQVQVFEYRDKLFSELQQSSKNLSNKLALYNRFLDSPQIFLDQRIQAKINQDDIRETENELSSMQNLPETNESEFVTLKILLCQFMNKKNDLQQVIQKHSAKLKLVQNLLSSQQQGEEVVQLIRDATSEDVIEISNELSKYSVSEYQQEQIAFQMIQQRITPHVIETIQLLKQTLQKYNENQDKLNVQINDMLSNKQSNLSKSEKLNSVLSDFEAEMKRAADSYIASHIQFHFTVFNQMAISSNDMHQEDVYSHQLRFDTLQHELTVLQEKQIKEPTREQYCTSRFQIIKDFARILTMNNSLGATFQFAQLLHRINQRISLIEMSTTKKIDEFRNLIQQQLKQFQQEKVNQLQLLFQQYFQFRLSSKFAEWNSPQEKEKLESEVLQLKQQIDNVSENRFRLPVLLIEESVDKILDEQIKLNVQLLKLTQTQNSVVPVYSYADPEQNRTPAELKDESAVESVMTASTDLRGLKQIIHTPEPKVDEAKLKSQQAAKQNPVPKRSSPQISPIQADKQAKGKKEAPPKPQSVKVAAEKDIAVDTGKFLEFMRKKQKIHRVLKAGMVEVFISLVGQVIKIEYNEKPAQQIKVMQIKNIRPHNINMLGIVMPCIDIYLENTKSVVFACDDKLQVDYWVKGVRLVQQAIKQGQIKDE